MTPQRYARIRQMLVARQPDFTVCIERVHKPHDVYAVIRTADAVGIHQIHAVLPGKRLRTMLSNAAGSNNWVSVKTHPNITSPIEVLPAQGMQIRANHHLPPQAVDYTRPTCILLGEEKVEISDKALTLSHQNIIIPMVGMVQSLNISVASTPILYGVQCQRHNVGMYHRAPILLPKEEQQRLFMEMGISRVS